MKTKIERNRIDYNVENALIYLEKAIIYKEDLIDELKEKSYNLFHTEFLEKQSRNEMMITTDWSEILTGKVTEKAKTAYIDKSHEKQLGEIEVLKIEINHLKRRITSCDDRISLYKYQIRVLDGVI